MGVNFSNGSSTSGLLVDIWRLTTNHQGNTDPLQNWERVDSNNHGYFGGNMSQSSGLFTFPKTGVYRIDYAGKAFLNTTTVGSHNCNFTIRVTVDNGSNFTSAAMAQVHFGGGGYSNSLNTSATCSCTCFFDVSDTSNHKVQFRYGAGQGHEYVSGNSSQNETYAVFTLLGDT